MTGIRAFYIYVALFAAGTAGAQLAPVVLPTWVSVPAGIALIPFLLTRALRPWAFLLAGLLWTFLRADLVLGHEWPASLESRDVVVVGAVASLPEPGQRYLKFDLDVEQAIYGGERVDFTGRIRLRWYEAPSAVAGQLKAGSRWRLRVRLKQPHGYYNPGVFDYEAYLFREGVRATGYVRRARDNTRLPGLGSPSIQRLRQRLRDRLQEVLPDTHYPGMLQALALGDRSGISDAQWRTLRRTGTSHLIAISGLHVGFAAGLGVLLGAGLGRVGALVVPTAAAPRAGAWAGLVLALLYAAVSGFGVPAQRAFAMAAVFLLGMLCRRHVWNVRGLCLALATVLLLQPASVHDPGFWLSFAAVAVILAWLATTGQGTRGGRVVQAAGLQCLLSLALLPLVAAFFGSAPLLSAPANLLAVPVVMFGVVPPCLAAVALIACGLDAVAALFVGLADIVLAGLWSVLSRLAALQFAAIPVQLEPWQAFAMLAGLLVLLSARGHRRLWGLAGLAVLLAPGPASPAPGELRVVVLDVGQGLSVVVETARHTLVYDTGPRYPSGFSLAERVVTPYLRSRSVRRIDMLIVSHGDNDHRGGYEDLRAAFPVQRVLSSIADELDGRAEYCRRGRRWTWDGVSFEILHPPQARPTPHNNASCVLRIRSAHGTVLLTGDVEAQTEALLLAEEGERLRSDVLLVPHQGSITSSTPAFIERVKPSRAVVAAGYRNRYGHPHPCVVARYRKRGIPLLSTARHGAVLIRFKRDGILLNGWRQLRPRYWLDRGPAAHADATIC
ncbi:MAG TPA: DNA internalization-related competence protein ComEC/Rec2 [Arenicellales bacterium]|nr:DNA internalization-related competence protein ComEC/Rec2 [Arenicellales bacterium]